MSIEVALDRPAGQFDSGELLDALGVLPAWRSHTRLADEYAASAGVWEGYSLRRHTQMVLDQYRRYFEGRNLVSSIDRRFVRLLLALHDCGKPAAVRADRKAEHHLFTLALVGRLWRQLPVTAPFSLFAAVVGADPFGSLFRGPGRPEDLDVAARTVRAQAQRAQMGVRDFLALLLLYYQCDVASYTADAGGMASLEGVFALPSADGALPFDQRLGRLRLNGVNERRLSGLMDLLANRSR